MRIVHFVCISLVLMIGAPKAALGQGQLPRIEEIQEISLGLTDAPGAQYVVFRLQDPTAPSITWLEVSDATGELLGAFGDVGMFSSSEGHFAYGPQASTSHYPGVDFLGSSFVTLPLEGGRVCLSWDEFDLDCVAWGSYSDGSSEWGSPAPAPPLGQALIRVSSTGDNSVDFVVGDPNPARYFSEEEPECDHDRPCDDGFECIAGVCVELECHDDKPCEEGLDCIDGACIDVECDEDRPCEEGFECIAWACIEVECDEDRPCEEGFDCIDYRCEEQAENGDGGGVPVPTGPGGSGGGTDFVSDGCSCAMNEMKPSGAATLLLLIALVFLLGRRKALHAVLGQPIAE